MMENNQDKLVKKASPMISSQGLNASGPGKHWTCCNSSSMMTPELLGSQITPLSSMNGVFGRNPSVNLT